MVASPDISEFTNLRGVKTCATAAEKTRKYCMIVSLSEVGIFKRRRICAIA
jgi:hypothetical protein